MSDNPARIQRIAGLVAKVLELTKKGELHWDRQVGSAHRYARWNNHLLILGPAESHDSGLPRYLFITPFNSPACLELTSNDENFGGAVLELVDAVEKASAHEPPTDPFSLSGDILERLES
ncbi:MAG TPA: hypothetical protein VGN86_18030 [Pyrinomonadaceae bacterium]|nr:hypothetical protein [Pyrinomonadaceae bacterium]